MSQTIALSTVAEVLDALGGNEAVRELTGLKTMQAVWVWRERGQIASHFYALMTDALRDRGFTARAQLWGQREADHVDGRDRGRHAHSLNG